MELPEIPSMALATLSSRAVYNSEAFFVQRKLEQLGYKVPDTYVDAAVLRSKSIKHHLENFLSKNPTAHILTLGCGFSTYYQELKDPKCVWIDTDLEPTVSIRYKIYPNTDNYTCLELDLNHAEMNDGVLSYKNKEFFEPDLIIAEGSLMYVSKEKAKNIIVNHNAKMIFDVLGSNRAKPLGPYHLWTYDYNEWDLKIKTKFNFDDTYIDSWLYQIND